MKKRKTTILKISSYENTMRQKERYNPYQCGTGIMKTDKYPSRAKRKEILKKELKNLRV